jgi:hypothetical protein
MLVRPAGRDQRPWNKGLLIGQKKPLEPKHVWSIRVRLEIARSWRDLVIFSSSRSRSSRGAPLKPGYQNFRALAPDISSQVDFTTNRAY